MKLRRIFEEANKQSSNFRNTEAAKLKSIEFLNYLDIM